MGGGEQRMGGDRTKSQIFDHTFCEYTFADGTKMFSQGRHLSGAWSHVGEAVHGSKGTANPAGSIRSADGDWRFRGNSPGGHQQEQHDLIEAIMAGNIYNEGEYGAKSTSQRSSAARRVTRARSSSGTTFSRAAANLRRGSMITQWTPIPPRCRVRTASIRFRRRANMTRLVERSSRSSLSQPAT